MCTGKFPGDFRSAELILKSLHMLFCREVVRWSRCAKGLNEVLRAKLCVKRLRNKKQFCFHLFPILKHHSQEQDVPLK